MQARKIISVQARAVRKAAEIAGSRKDLAMRLAVTQGEIDDWLDGARKMPHSIFVRVVSLILDEGESGPADPPQAPPERSAAGAATW